MTRLAEAPAPALPTERLRGRPAIRLVDIELDAIPTDPDGVPLGHDPACRFWGLDALKQNAITVVAHRQRCERCMAFAIRVADAVRRARRESPELFEHFTP